MEHMAQLLFAVLAVAVYGDTDALGAEEICHGPGVIPEEIAASGGNMGGGITVCNVLQNLQPGVRGGDVRIEVVSDDSFALAGGQGGGVV